MSAGNVKINEGTQTGLLVDTAGTVDVGVIKVDISTAGTYGSLWDGKLQGGTLNAATISALPNIPGGSIVQTTGTVNTGTINVGTVNTGTINTGTIDLLKAGTITRVEGGSIVVTAGTVNVGTIATLPNLPQGSINMTAGTVTAGTINVATITSGTLQNLVSGTINSATVVINSATISVLPNLPQGSINVTAGTISTGTINTGTINIGTFVGNIASGAADSGNPVKIGGVYQGTASVGTSGQRLDLQVDINGNLKVTEAGLLAGEDLTNNVFGILQKPVVSTTYSPLISTTAITAATKMNAKSAPGQLLTISATNANSIIRYLLIIDKVSTPAGADAPIAAYPIPAGSANSPGFLALGREDFGDNGLACAAGVSYAISTTAASFTDSATASDHIVNAYYI